MAFDPRNCLETLRPVNPLPENAKTLDTGDAGKDGYSVLSRARGNSSYRPRIGDLDEAPIFGGY